MDKQKVITQLFYGKVAELIGFEKTLSIMEECKNTIELSEQKPPKPPKTPEGRTMRGNNTRLKGMKPEINSVHYYIDTKLEEMRSEIYADIKELHSMIYELENKIEQIMPNIS